MPKQPIFTKKHYESIAKMIHDIYLPSQLPRDGGNVIYYLADLFAEDNPNFNRGKFYSACGEEIE